MRNNDLIGLEAPIKRMRSPFDYLERRAAGKSVLNVGAAGGIGGYLPGNKEIWLHHRLQQVAAEIVAVDIDRESIAYARKYDVEILHANCETMDLERKFDLIVLSDVIEHMDAPVHAIVNLMRHLAPGGALCITTPNATAAVGFARALLRSRPNVYWDHVGCYMPEHIQGICDRYNFKLTEIYFFDHTDGRSLKNIVKSRLSAVITGLFPGLATAFLAVVENNV